MLITHLLSQLPLITFSRIWLMKSSASSLTSFGGRWQVWVTHLATRQFARKSLRTDNSFALALFRGKNALSWLALTIRSCVETMTPWLRIVKKCSSSSFAIGAKADRLPLWRLPRFPASLWVNRSWNRFHLRSWDGWMDSNRQMALKGSPNRSRWSISSKKATFVAIWDHNTTRHVRWYGFLLKEQLCQVGWHLNDVKRTTLSDVGQVVKRCWCYLGVKTKMARAKW